MEQPIAEGLTEAVAVFDGELARPNVVVAESGVAAIVSVRSPAKESPNEDAAAVIPIAGGGVAIAVADGCGGHSAGEQAARIAIETLYERLCARDGADNGAREAVIDAFDEANRRIAALGLGAGTTLAVALISHGEVRAFHAGDSEVLVTGQRGKIKLQTLAHAPVAYGVESGYLDEHAAMHHEDRALISNLLGSPEMRIEMSSATPLSTRDTVLVASDGVTDNLWEREMIECVRSGPIEEAASRLADACLSRMKTPGAGEPSKPDDLTFVLYRRANQ